jgi:hypothetical protein
LPRKPGTFSTKTPSGKFQTSSQAPGNDDTSAALVSTLVNLERATKDPEWMILDSGMCHTWDKADPTHPFKPLPDFVFYLRLMLRWMHTHENSAFVKSRDVMATLTISLYCLWTAMLHSGREVICISDKAEKAEHNLGRIWKAYESMPPMVRQLIKAQRWKGTSSDPRIIAFNRHPPLWPGAPAFEGSRIEAIAQGADKIQEYHPSLVFFDQVETTRELGATMAAIFPVMKPGTKTIMCGVACPGPWEEVCHDRDEFSEEKRIAA